MALSDSRAMTYGSMARLSRHPCMIVQKRTMYWPRRFPCFSLNVVALKLRIARSLAPAGSVVIAWHGGEKSL